ncbi:MAG TPA: cyclase family protein [Azospirillaceae bacterium]|nr:cyclase family protein [Azospirillaceae bacterium]
MNRTILSVGAALGAGLVAIAAASAAQEPWWNSKYGEDDTLGAVNNLSPEGVRKAARLIRSGKTYSLAIPTGPNSPAYGSRRYEVTISPAPGGNTTPNGSQRVTSHDERVVTSMGIGTQLDGLGHLGVDHHYYNGLTGAELNTKDGFKKLELSNIPPIVTRGVVIDMTKHYQRQLVVGDAFGRAEIEAAMRAQRLRINRGDVVLFHTGWMRMIAEDKATYNRSEPGLTEDGAQYLADLGVVAVGADNIALEQLPSPPGKSFIVHQTLLAKNGVHILENVNTGPLVADGVKEFMFVLGQPRFVGTVQVVVNPIAIR